MTRRRAPAPPPSYANLGRQHLRPGWRVVTYRCGCVYVLRRDEVPERFCPACPVNMAGAIKESE